MTIDTHLTAIFLHENLVYIINYFIFAPTQQTLQRAKPEKTMEKTDPKTDLRRLFKRSFLRQFSTFAVTCLFLTVVNYFTSPGCWWIQWVALGWGLQLLLLVVRRRLDCDEEHDYR